MEIKKITDKYQLYKDGASYVVDFGETKRAEDKTVFLEITGVEEAGLLQLHGTCGCTATEKTLNSKESATFKITYSDCDSEFNKVVSVRYNSQQLTTILLRGKCNQ